MLNQKKKHDVCDHDKKNKKRKPKNRLKAIRKGKLYKANAEITPKKKQ
jgi:hypothetical protein